MRALLIVLLAGGLASGAHGDDESSSSDIQGLVVEPDGSPVPSYGLVARPWATLAETAPLAVRVRTDAKGRFRMSDVRPGVYRLMRDPAIQTATHVRMEPHLCVPGASDLRLVVARYRDVAGRVVGAGGPPVASAVVRLRPLGDTWAQAVSATTAGGDPLHWQGVTDAEGRFRAAGMAGHVTWTLEVLPGGDLAEAWMPHARTLSDGARQPLEIDLAPAHDVRGQVRFPDGRPVSDAKVTWSTWGVHRGREGWASGWRVTRTEADGSFRIFPLAPGQRIQIRGYGPADDEAAWFPSEGTDVRSGADGLALVIRPAHTIRVRVPQVPPALLRGRRVRALPVEGPMRQARFAGDEASLRIGPLHPGWVALHLDPRWRRGRAVPLGAWPTEPVSVRVGGTPDTEVVVDAFPLHTVTIRVDRQVPRQTLRGVLRDARGRSHMLRRQGRDPLGFECTEVAPGPATIGLSTHGRSHGAIQTINVPSSGVVEMHLKPTGSIAGVIEGLPRGPCRGSVVASRLGQLVESSVSPGGAFRLEGLPPGCWRLAFHLSSPLGGSARPLEGIDVGTASVKARWTPDP